MELKSFDEYIVGEMTLESSGFVDEFVNSLFEDLELNEGRLRDEEESHAGDVVKTGIKTWLAGIVAFKLKDLIEPYFSNPKWRSSAGEHAPANLVGKKSLRMGARGKIARTRVNKAFKAIGKSGGKAWKFLAKGVMNNQKAAAVGAILFIVSTAAVILYKKVQRRKSLEFKRSKAHQKVDRKLIAEIKKLKKEELTFKRKTRERIEAAKLTALKEKDKKKLQAMINNGFKAKVENVA